MKKRTLALAALFVILSILPGAVMAQAKLKLGFVDRQLVFEELEETDKIKGYLEKEQKERQEEIDGKKEKMDGMLKEFKDLEEKKDDSSVKKREEIRKTLEGRFDDLKTLHNKYMNDLQTIEKQELKKLKTKIDKSIETVAKKKGYDLVLEKEAVYFGGDDLTQTVIDFMNKGK